VRTPSVAHSIANLPLLAHTHHTGDDRAAWAAHDATALVASYKGPPLPCLIDTGSADGFLESQLKPKRFEAAAKAAGFDATVRMQVCFCFGGGRRRCRARLLLCFFERARAHPSPPLTTDTKQHT
jgi:hypothetical protein